jgi:restriction system protein
MSRVRFNEKGVAVLTAPLGSSARRRIGRWQHRGVISLDRLGLEKGYIQAKRWRNTVGSPGIQASRALSNFRAHRKACSSPQVLSQGRKARFGKARGSIVLVAGEQLAVLMMDHGVGVSHRPLRVPRVDNDYFVEG